MKVIKTHTEYFNELWFGFFFSAKTDDEGDFLRILSYKKMTDITYEDIERMENYYDCSCEVIRIICGQSCANKSFNFSFFK